MKTVLVFLAEGFEEIEAITIVDILRRANVDCKMVSVTAKKEVVGAHGITVIADMLFEEEVCFKADGVVLPGGMPGTINLQNHVGVTNVLRAFDEQKKYIAAICAAPMVFGGLGLVNGKKATIYPGMEQHLKGAVCSDDIVCEQEHIITSKAPGTAMAFALKLAEVFTEKQKAEQLQKELVYSNQF